MNEQLSSFAEIEEAIQVQRGILDSFLRAPMPQLRNVPAEFARFRPETHLIVDEWGVWDRIVPEEANKYGALWMQSTLRSAIAAGMGLNVFHRQADKLYMCNIAQTVNVLQSVLLAYEDHCIRTSTYYAFLLQKPHRAKTAVRVESKDTAPLGISMSASRKDDELVATFINPKHDAHLKVNGTLVGASAVSATAQLLHHADYNACNTFEDPNVIAPKDHTITVDGPRIQLELPPLSMATATVRLSA
jgi:alpha-N-arabinofuranosidase